MTLQERILEVLDAKALTPRALYDAMKGDLPSAVDFALRGLLKSCQVSFELGHYQRSKQAPNCAESAEKPAIPRTVANTAPKPVLIRCRRCKEPKPVEDFDFEPGRRVRMKTCNRCIEKARQMAKPVATIEAGKGEVERRRNPTFSPDLIARLVEMQRVKAEQLQITCNHIVALRQELADIEELVRTATAREPA